MHIVIVCSSNFVDKLTFVLKANHIEIDDLINQKFIEISNRQQVYGWMKMEKLTYTIA